MKKSGKHYLLTRALSLLIFSNALSVQAQKGSSFEKELERLDCSVALVIPSSSIDEHPLFSPDLDYLGFNYAGEWKKISLANIELTGATWLNMQIGYNEPVGLKSLKKKELDSFMESTSVQKQRLVLKDKTTVELKPNGFSTSLLITTPGYDAVEIWATGM